MKIITMGMLKRIAQKHKYILLRSDHGYWQGLNTKALNIGENKNKFDSAKLIGFTGYIPCNIAEYINYKMEY